MLSKFLIIFLIYLINEENVWTYMPSLAKVDKSCKIKKYLLCPLELCLQIYLEYPGSCQPIRTTIYVNQSELSTLLLTYVHLPPCIGLMSLLLKITFSRQVCLWLNLWPVCKFKFVRYCSVDKSRELNLFDSLTKFENSIKISSCTI